MPQAITISGKNVFVTGANRGIGKEIVHEFIRRGAKKIYLGVRSTGKAQELVEQYGDKVEELVLDLSSADLATSLPSKLSDVEILINNAGVLDTVAITADDAVASIEKNMAVNLYGVVYLTNALIPSLKEKAEAAIITVGSLVSFANMPLIGTYSVSKAAVFSAIQGYRAHLANHPILVAGVYPGAIDTDMTEGMQMKKDTPQNVAKGIADGIEAGEEAIFPDAMSKASGPLYFKAPKELEKAFSVYIA